MPATAPASNGSPSNDEPEDHDPETIAEMISSVLLADLFGVEPKKVGADVTRYRAKHADDYVV